MRDLIDNVLQQLNCHVERYQHPPLPSSDAASRLSVQRSGQQIKNLFLHDNYKRKHFLLLTAPEKKVDLKELSNRLGVSRLGFASARRLEKFLQGMPGHVSFLLLLNDTARNVELLVDRDIWQAEKLQAHPGVNTETYVMEKQDVELFLKHTGHQPKVVEIPSEENAND